MRILRLNKQDTAGIEERQAAERPPPLSGEAGPERAGDRDRLGFVRPCSAGPYIPFVWIQNKRSVPRLTMAEKLKIISLGGLNEIGKNMTVYEYGGDIIVIDVGMGFPDDDMYGIDVVIPDFSYLIKNKDRIRGIFLTHGHEDHIGSIPYLLRDINVPIYATRMTAGLVKLKLEEHRLLNKTKLITCEAGEVVRAGKFTVEFIHVNHSIADACGFAIKCGVGTVVHTGDFKIDPTPIQGGMMDLGRLGQLGKEGVLALLADSTNVERPGFTKSERSVGDSFDALFRGCQQRIIVTTFASNVDRIQQIIDVAARYGRKVAVTGRSMENAMKVSTELGYMNIPDGVLVDLAHIKSLPKHKICIITTGSQGETMSALSRMAFNTHRQVEIQAGDRVILSASAIPGNENAIGSVINELYRKDAEVVNERLGALHVSGHACQEELKIIHALVKPKFFIPVHGEQRHLKTHAKLAQQMGMTPNQVIIGDIGRVIELTHSSAKLAGTERGITEPTPTFSACFGAAFLSLHPTKYGEELVKKMKKAGAKAYLVNTGWNGTGKRISIKDTRGIIDAILDGSIDKAPTKTLPIFDFTIPTELPGVDPKILDPRDTYKNAKDWDVKAEDLANRFVKNFVKFTGNEEGKKLVAAGPKVK